MWQIKIFVNFPIAYQFAVDCGTYWKETRGLPACKGDHASYNGMDVYYNGPDTIADKTRYAIENLGGVMVWELTQDTTVADKSLLQAIGRSIEENSPAESIPW